MRFLSLNLTRILYNETGEVRRRLLLMQVNMGESTSGGNVFASNAADL